MREFFSGWKFKVILALAVLLLGVMLYSASVGGEGNLFQNVISYVTVPFQRGAAYVSDSITGFFDRYWIADYEAKDWEGEQRNPENDLPPVQPFDVEW